MRPRFSFTSRTLSIWPRQSSKILKPARLPIPPKGLPALKIGILKQEEFGNEVYCIYINCWKKDTTFKIILEICLQLKYKWIQNKNSDQLLSEICEILNEKAAVIVLDEIDKLEDDGIIYSLLEDLKRKTLILITNREDFLVTLDDRIRSRLTPDVLDFQSYNMNETEGILKQRLEYVFVANTFDNSAFLRIAEKTFEVKDIRSGLFLMKESGEIAESKSLRKINIAEAEQAISKLEEFKLKKEDVFENEDNELIELIKNNSGKTMTELFDIYKEKEGKSYKTLQRKLKYLEKSGLILLKENNKGSGRIFTVEYNNKTLNEFS